MRYLLGLSAAALVAVAAFFMLSSTKSEQTSTIAKQPAAASTAQDAPAPAALPEPVEQVATVAEPEPPAPTPLAEKEPVRVASVRQPSRPSRSPAVQRSLRPEPVAVEPVADTVSDADPMPDEEAPVERPTRAETPVPAPEPAPVVLKPVPTPAVAKPAPAPVVLKPLPEPAAVKAPAPAEAPVPAAVAKPAPAPAPVLPKPVPQPALVAVTPTPVPEPAPVVLKPEPALAPVAVQPIPAPVAVAQLPAPTPAPAAAPAPTPAPVQPEFTPEPVLAKAPEVAPLEAVAAPVVDVAPAPVTMAKVMPADLDGRPMPAPSIAPVEKVQAEIEHVAAPAESVPVKSLYINWETNTAELISSDSTPKPRAPIKIQAARFRDISVALHSIARDITAGTEAGKSLAFGDITALNDGSREKHLGEIASEVLMTKSIQANGPRIVERSQVTRVLDEMNMSSLGLTQERSASKVGLMLGADYVLAGTVMETEGEALLTVTKVNVADGRTVAVWEAHFPVETARPLADEYMEKRTRTDALVRSLIFPGWGQFYNGDNIKGAAFLGVGAGLVALTAYEYTKFQDAQSNYETANSESESVSAFSKAETAKNQVYALGAITALFWGVNGAEAYINGSSESKVRVQAATPASGGQGVEVSWKW